MVAAAARGLLGKTLARALGAGIPGPGRELGCLPVTKANRSEAEKKKKVELSGSLH